MIQERIKLTTNECAVFLFLPAQLGMSMQVLRKVSAKQYFLAMNSA